MLSGTQGIIWCNMEQSLCRYMASLGPKEQNAMKYAGLQYISTDLYMHIYNCVSVKIKDLDLSCYCHHLATIEICSDRKIRILVVRDIVVEYEIILIRCTTNSYKQCGMIPRISDLIKWAECLLMVCVKLAPRLPTNVMMTVGQDPGLST